MSYIPNTLVNKVDDMGPVCRLKTSTNIEYNADHVIICNGSDFQTLFPSIFRNAPIEISQLHMLETESHRRVIMPNILTGLSIRRYESFKECPSYEMVKRNETKDSFQQKYGIHILLKQLLDGGIVIGDSHEYYSTKEDIPFQINEEINAFMLAEAKKILDLDSWKIKKTWLAHYSQMNNGEFVFNHSVTDKIHICTGIGGKGMTASFGYAEINLDKIFNKKIDRCLNS